jgi:hypothetical protein
MDTRLSESLSKTIPTELTVIAEVLQILLAIDLGGEILPVMDLESPF